MRNTGDRIRTLIVEDDVLNIALLQKLIATYCPELEVTATAKNSDEFVEALFLETPDLILLDIHLGEQRNSLEILSEIKDLQSEIIIISADESQALKAINQYHVAGYLLKPINIVQLKSVVKSALHHINLKIIAQRSEGFHSEVLIAVSTTKSIEFLVIKDILYLEADGKYTIFHLLDQEVKVVSKNIGEYEKILPPQLFFRIHHKYIVNIQKVVNINRSEGIYCHLVNGESLSISKRRQDTLRKFLNV
ncbi:LytTR family DNA-binding domain-containing protein [Polaribacter sp. HL-MS24]|uniref:LytR/AlgR family response regulator transcription factor n=1 Tax=Polaribacter sp. HL-MS24 TaxID=3077735 RepID=UPI00293470D3|nr:LytTR family DNA-binding domain-containing protein [Polaribacter sp. HL-MS24]WOC39435.1 LytTR family DNA-binding domain-containing protein [Polaribacter sp. HL-MS24]